MRTIISAIYGEVIEFSLPSGYDITTMRHRSLENLIEPLRNGAPVLTVNARLARHIRSAYDDTMREAGLSAWRTPEVMPFTAWVRKVWEENGTAAVLGGGRSTALWERIVSADRELENAYLLPGIAKTSYEAYSLVHEYGIRLPDEDISLTEEARALKRWKKAYEEELKRLGYIDQARVPFEVFRLISSGIAPPKEIVLAGFDELSPASNLIVDAMRAREVRISFWPESGGAASQAVVRPFEDEKTEVVQAARWARGAAAPGVTIGFIVPELEKYRGLIEREFSYELDPASVLPGAEEHPVFNISLGRPLIYEPLARSAIDVISIGEGKEDLAKISSIIRSPYFTGPEKEALLRIDFLLKEDNRLSISLYELKRISNADAPGFSKRVDAWLEWLKGTRKKQLPSQWARAFSGALDKAGWLGAVTLSGHEFQALAAWNACLEELASLDDITGLITRAEAAARLASITRDKIHQPETPECNIQVLGLLESAGLSFDHVWIIGCHEYALPAEPAPNPFIPVHLQKARNVPRSSSERELAFARKAASRILKSSPSVTVSYPAAIDGREVRVSPLFAEAKEEIWSVSASSRLSDAEREGDFLEWAQTGPLIPVSEAEKGLLRGGTLILKNQSLCPFRAFAVHRLNAKTVPLTELGLRADARGRVMHEAMRLFWEKAAGSAKLKSMKESGELDACIKEIAGMAVATAEIPPPLSDRFVELEKKRLEALIMDWAAIELSRGRQFTVKTLELEKEIEIGGLKIKGRVDRIDELEDGSAAIIDYKSGSPERKDWLTKRPKEPQLLIYCAAGEFKAVSFARLFPGDCRFVGISKDDGTLTGVKPYDEDRFRKDAGGLDWEGLMDFWKEAVESLARDFMAGVNDVDPNGGRADDNACKYCELFGFCRIFELGFHRDGNEDGK